MVVVVEAHRRAVAVVAAVFLQDIFMFYVERNVATVPIPVHKRANRPSLRTIVLITGGGGGGAGAGGGGGGGSTANQCIVYRRKRKVHEGTY